MLMHATSLKVGLSRILDQLHCIKGCCMKTCTYVHMDVNFCLSKTNACAQHEKLLAFIYPKGVELSL